MVSLQRLLHACHDMQVDQQHGSVQAEDVTPAAAPADAMQKPAVKAKKRQVC
jgi:hypothetical protein